MICRLVISLALCAGAAAQDATNGLSEAAAREAEKAAVLLVQENERLMGEAARLREQVARLTVSLAEAVAELDVERSRMPPGGEAGGGAAARAGDVDASDLRVLDVNRPLNMVVFGGGTDRGVKPGMVFAVLRDRAVVARVRTVDVRAKIAGAVMEDVSEGRYPEKGDRVILAR
jgi:hypothetical protein